MTNPHNVLLEQLRNYLDIIFQVDRSIYIRCHQTSDPAALARGLASLLNVNGEVHIFQYEGNPLPQQQEEQILAPLMTGITVVFVYSGDNEVPLHLIQKWESIRSNLSERIEKQGFLSILQVFDDEDPIPFEGSTRWFFEEEVEAIEKKGKEIDIKITQLK